MNYNTPSRQGCLYLPSQGGAKSSSTDGYASSCFTIERGAAAVSTRRTIPTTTSRTSFFLPASFPRSGISQPAVPSKWFKEPKIPIRLNSSTLIRMKSKNSSMYEAMGDTEANNQLRVAAISFLKRDRRMSDYEVAKGTSPFGDSSFVKNVFLNIVSHRASEAAVFASANPAGDGGLTSATYHRISALSLNDSQSGCNLKFVERVSYEGAGPSPAAMDVDPVGAASVTTSSQNSGISGSVRTLNEMLQRTILSESKKPQNGDDEASDVGDKEGESKDSRIRLMKKKKVNRKYKRPVVVTSLKNSSVKFVRKVNSGGTGPS